MQFAGPNGRVLTNSMAASTDAARSVAQSLSMLDTSKTKWMEILRSVPPSKDLHQALLSLKNLRTLTLSLCKDLHSFIHTLAPVPNSTGPMACPKLEELILHTAERFNIETMVEVAAARASRGLPFKSVSIISWGELVSREGMRELLKYVSHVESSFENSNVNYSVGSEWDLDYSDEEDREGESSGGDSEIS